MFSPQPTIRLPPVSDQELDERMRGLQQKIAAKSDPAQATRCAPLMGQRGQPLVEGLTALLETQLGMPGPASPKVSAVGQRLLRAMVTCEKGGKKDIAKSIATGMIFIDRQDFARAASYLVDAAEKLAE